MHSRDALTRCGFNTKRPAGEQLPHCRFMTCRRMAGNVCTHGSGAATASRRAASNSLARHRYQASSAARTASVRNESSVVVYGDFEGRGVLLTGRAGVRALGAAADCAERLGLDLPSTLRLLQLPNKGSAANLSTSILDRLVGPALRKSGGGYTKSAFASVSLDATGVPSRTVTDALTRRGVASFATRGMSLHHAHEMPDRGWYTAKPSALQP